MNLLDELSGAADGDAGLRLILRHFAADTGTIHRLGADGLLHLAALCGSIPPPIRAAIETIPVGKGMAGLAAARGVPVESCDIQSDTSGDVRPGAKATGQAGAITVPIRVAQQLVGVLGIASREPRVFSEAEKDLLQEAGRTLANRLAAK